MKLTTPAAAALAVVLSPAMVRAQPTECEGVNLRVKAVSKNGSQNTTVEFGNTGGQLDSTPVLETQIQVFLRTWVVHFSAQAEPFDNHIIFQASIDNNPMLGHALFPYVANGPLVPVVWDPKEHATLGLSRMVSYTFTAPVGPGTHTVRIRFAGCCSAAPPPGVVLAMVRNAVMSVHF